MARLTCSWHNGYIPSPLSPRSSLNWESFCHFAGCPNALIALRTLRRRSLVQKSTPCECVSYLFDVTADHITTSRSSNTKVKTGSRLYLCLSWLSISVKICGPQTVLFYGNIVCLLFPSWTFILVNSQRKLESESLSPRNAFYIIYHQVHFVT